MVRKWVLFLFGLIFFLEGIITIGLYLWLTSPLGAIRIMRSKEFLQMIFGLFLIYMAIGRRDDRES